MLYISSPSILNLAAEKVKTFCEAEEVRIAQYVVVFCFVNSSDCRI